MESIPRIRSSIKSTSTKQIAYCCKIQPPPSGGSILEHCQVLPPTSPKLGAAAKPFFAPPFPTIFGLRKEKEEKAACAAAGHPAGGKRGRGTERRRGYLFTLWAKRDRKEVSHRTASLAGIDVGEYNVNISPGARNESATPQLQTRHLYSTFHIPYNESSGWTRDVALGFFFQLRSWYTWFMSVLK